MTLIHPILLDAILINAYRSFGVPTDRIVTDANLLHDYIATLPPQFHSVDPGQIARRLLNLRKGRRLPTLTKSRRTSTN